MLSKQTQKREMSSSPTKEIRRALGDLSLHESDIINTDRKQSAGSIKNHLQVPQFLLNKDFDKENHMSTMDGSAVGLAAGEDTVVHNKDSHDTTMPEWLKVKLEVEEKKKVQTSQDKKQRHVSSLPKPHLVRSYLSGSTAAEFDDDEDEGEHGNIKLAPADTTWEQMKRNYNIRENEVYGELTHMYQEEESDEESQAYEKENRYSNEDGDDNQAMNNTAYSFQDSNSFKVITEEIPTLVTAKATSYRTEFLDSPMPRPKLIKTLEDVLPPLKRPQLMTELQEVELITPMDEGMVFDSSHKMWVYPNNATKTGYDYELVFDDDTNVSVAHTNLDSTTTADPRHVTNVSRLDLSFSESRKALIAALQDVLRSRKNWDKVTRVDISGKSLLTVKSLEEFVPNLKDVNLNDNSLTSLEGLSALLQTAFLSNNSISDQFLNFDKYKNMQQLDLSHNSITKLGLFASLENLRYLHLSHCRVDSLVSLPSLLKLDLSDNEITGVVDFSHLNFMNMQELNLAGNKITEVRSLSCDELRILNLERNEISSISIVRHLPKMKKLLLAGNSALKELDAGTKLKQLRVLSVPGCTNVTGKFPELLTLCVYECNGLSILTNKFVVSQYLQEIVLRSCQLNFQDLKPLWSMFPHLRRFDLRDNKVECSYTELVKFFKQFGKVSDVRLEQNPVTDRLKELEHLKAYELMMFKLTHQ